MAASTPTPQDVERALKRLTADQFTHVCSEIGILELTLAGGTQAARAADLVQRTKGHPDFNVLIRAIHRVNPTVWHAAPPAASISSLAYGIGAFTVVAAIGGLILVLILSGSDQASQATPTATWTPAPTRTPVPTFTHTASPTPIPSDTPEPTATPTPTRDPSVVPTTALPRPTHTPSATASPPVSIIYSKVELQRPQSGGRFYPSDTVEFRWLLREGTLAGNERYWMRVYSAGGALAESFLTADPWRFAVGGPSNVIGEFTWTVTIVRVDAAGNIIGALSPESDAWRIEWRT
jgi:hypothetical protein